ncbi:MAG TPA: TrbI/VirB10 family protein [Vicinamibacterales bacterium]|nr:TrbI/VirB10 family protein [Vicinamibacterales bacterium]
MSKALLAFVCLAAGAGGTYLAVRATSPTSATTQAAISPEPTPTATVDQSEAVVTESPVPPAIVAPARPATVAPAAPRSAPPAPRATTRTTRRSEAAAPAAVSAPAPREEAPIAIAPAPVSDNQASRSIDPPGPVLEELVVAAQSVIGLQMESSVSSDRARVEDQVVARVTRDVKVGDRVAIPAGAKANGEVTVVERGGKVRDRARLGVRFTSIVLADGTRLPIETETIYREGDSPGRESSAKIGGGAIGGAIIGGILGGAKGAAIGGSVGAGAGTAAVMAGGRNNATLASGSPVTVRLEEPVTVTVEK